MERETFVWDNVLIGCVGRVGGGIWLRRGMRDRKKELVRGKHLVEMFPSPGNDEKEGGWSP